MERAPNSPETNEGMSPKATYILDTYVKPAEALLQAAERDTISVKDALAQILTVLYDEANADQVLATDRATLGDDYTRFEDTITAVHSAVEQLATTAEANSALQPLRDLATSLN